MTIFLRTPIVSSRSQPEESNRSSAEFARMPDARRSRFVPGHGDVASLDDVNDFRAYLLDLQRLVAAGRKAGLRDDALARDVAPKLKARHPEWSISDRAAASEVRYMDQELAGTKRRPVPQPN